MGGGRFCDGAARFLAGLTGKERPRMLYIGTAMAEDPAAALRMYDRFADLADVSRLEFFPWPPEDLRSVVLESDLVFVGGGNTANMLAIWRLHGVDALLREALGEGDRPGRVERRRDLLVRAGRHGLVRAAARADGLPRVPARKLLPALGRRGAAPASVLRSC